MFGLGDVDEIIQNWLFEAKTSLIIGGHTLFKISWMLDVVAWIGFNGVRVYILLISWLGCSFWA